MLGKTGYTEDYLTSDFVGYRIHNDIKAVVYPKQLINKRK